MKLLKKLVWLTPVALIIACSSMIPEDSSEGMLPEDFVLSEYAVVNPDLAFFQVESKIKSDNKTLMASERAVKVDSIVKADSTADATAFLADAATMEKLYDFLKYNEQNPWTTFEEMSSIAIPRYEYAPDSFSVKSMVNLFQQILLPFNSLGKTPAEDWTIIQSYYAQIDSVLIEKQYYLYGEIEGRPYRFCKADETVTLRDKNDPEQATLNTLGTPDFRPNKYCKDAASGAVYLIK